MATHVLTEKLCSDLNSGKIVASEVGATITTVNEGNLRQYMYELCSAVAKGQLKHEKFTTAIKAAGLSAESIASHLVDTLWFTWLELDGKETEQEQFVCAVKSCMEEGLLTKRALLETGEVDFLEKAGIVANAATWRNKEIRINTRQVYLQQK